MWSSSRSRQTWAACLLGLLVTIGSLEPIENYDYFWHLATGEWIIEHRALPETDPFTLASDDGTWINLEWLFQAILYPAYELLGHAGLTVLLALLIGAGTVGLFFYAADRSSVAASLLLCAIAWTGASFRIDLRAETAAIPFLVIFLIVLFRNPDRRSLLIALLLPPIWFAVHPSALLAPVLAGLVTAGAIFSQAETRREIIFRFVQTIGSGLSLLINPWGLDGVLAPVRLAGLLEREGLVNLEWLPSSPRTFPGLYATLIVAILLVALMRKDPLRWAKLLALAFLGALAVRYVRNQALFYPALPVLVATAIPALSPIWNRVLVIGAALLVAGGLTGQNPGLGIDVEKFPVRTVERLQTLGLEGNVYNPDQFGGYLVWSFYPDRRTLVDGRNELHVEFFRRFERARLDSREWRKMFSDYDLDLAVEEYRSDYIEAIDGVTGERSRVPPSLVLFPRDDWALIGFDESSMLFAKRDAYPASVLHRAELRAIVPDASDSRRCRSREVSGRSEGAPIGGVLAGKLSETRDAEAPRHCSRGERGDAATIS